MNVLKNEIEIVIDRCSHCPHYNFTSTGDREEEYYCDHESAPYDGFIIDTDNDEIPDLCPLLPLTNVLAVDPIVVVLNGYPTSGKDTFCEIADEVYEIINHSTVDTVKSLARQMGWDGEKTPEMRNMLSALKDFYVEWFDGTFHEIQELILHENMNRECQFIFVHAREPEEIGRIKDWCEEINTRCFTVFIERSVDTQHGNHADANVRQFDYDLYIDNNGSMELFYEKSIDIFRRMVSNEPLMKFM